MKKIILLLVLFAGVSFKVLAQQTDSLAFDENNKYIYYQVVAQPALTADTIYKRALNFLTSAYPKDFLKLTKSDAGQATLKGQGGISLYKQALVSKHEDARVKFNLVIEVKDGKYRYWFTDFVVVPYQRDRYANFVPTNGKNTPLEHGLRKFGQKDLDSYLEQTLTGCRNMSNKLKTYVSNPSSMQKEIKIKPSIKKEW